MTFTDILQIPVKHTEDQILTLSGVTWEDYQNLAAEENGYLVSYYKNTITIVSPGRNHERLAEIIGLVINAYCLKYQIKVWALGSKDVKKESLSGKQPDKSFCFESEKEIPDLAIEINYTSGSVDDLEKYRLAGVTEVWMWQNEQFIFYSLVDDNYLVVAQSKALERISSQLINKIAGLALGAADDLEIQREFGESLWLET